MANSVDPDQTAPIGAVSSGSTLFPSIPNWSVMLRNYLQQTTSADNIFRCIFFLGALRRNALNTFTIHVATNFKSGGNLKCIIIGHLSHRLKVSFCDQRMSMSVFRLSTIFSNIS